jgi:hypothetical protein
MLSGQEPGPGVGQACIAAVNCQQQANVSAAEGAGAMTCVPNQYFFSSDFPLP